MSADTTTSLRGVVVSEPRLPLRSRRPSDLARLVGSLLLLAIPLVLGSVAVSTSTGLEQDLLRSFDAIRGCTKLVLLLGIYAAGFLLLAVPVGLGLDLLLRRRPWQLLDALIAATVAIAIASALRWWIVHEEPGRVLEVLTRVVDTTGERTQPIQGLLTAIVAFLTLAGLGARRWWRPLAIVSLAAVSLFGFLSGTVTALSTIVSLLLGWSIGLAVRYAIGAASTRPSGAEVADALVAANDRWRTWSASSRSRSSRAATSASWGTPAPASSSASRCSTATRTARRWRTGCGDGCGCADRRPVAPS